MIRLSVNVNKVATLRNSRGGRSPDVLEAVEACIAAGAPGITVHPRAYCRHIAPSDVSNIAHALAGSGVEFNIEGDPRPELLHLVEQLRPDQCTLVPVVAGEITSQAGWQPGPQTDGLSDVVRRFQSNGIRVSLFVDPEAAPIEWAASVGADRVELYTEPFARAFERGKEDGLASFETYAAAARLAASWAWASTPGTISTWPTSRCSAGCRSWMRSRLATPSSPARCLSGSTRSFARPSMFWRLPDMIRVNHKAHQVHEEEQVTAFVGFVILGVVTTDILVS